MPQQKQSVVTQERFASGMTWSQYMDQINRNKEKFQYNYDETVLAENDVATFRKLAESAAGPSRVLALGEDWCPDVFRGLPVMARIAEAAGMDLRIFPRDDNLDIMNEFLNQGEHQSIPTFVFYSDDHQYITHWVERPARANAEIGDIQKLFEGLDPQKDRQKMRELYDDFQRGPQWASWRQETVRELRELLSSRADA